MVRWGGVAATFLQTVRVMTPRLLTVLRIRAFVKLIEFGVRKQVWWVNMHVLLLQISSGMPLPKTFDIG